MSPSNPQRQQGTPGHGPPCLADAAGIEVLALLRTDLSSRNKTCRFKRWDSSRYGMPRTISGPINFVSHTGNRCQIAITALNRPLEGRASWISPQRE